MERMLQSNPLAFYTKKWSDYHDTRITPCRGESDGAAMWHPLEISQRSLDIHANSHSCGSLRIFLLCMREVLAQWNVPVTDGALLMEGAMYGS